MYYPQQPQGQLISIHALREEGDAPKRFASTMSQISIHALREEGDHARNSEYPQDEEFLSTPSARRATDG